MRPWERPGLLKPTPPLPERILNSPRSLPGKKEGSVPQSPSTWGSCFATHTPASANSYFQERTSENHTFGSSPCKFSFDLEKTEPNLGKYPLLLLSF